jgi:hypothetical protein
MEAPINEEENKDDKTSKLTSLYLMFFKIPKRFKQASVKMMKCHKSMKLWLDSEAFQVTSNLIRMNKKLWINYFKLLTLILGLT